MTELKIMHGPQSGGEEHLTDTTVMVKRLAAVGVHFEQFALAGDETDRDANQDEVIEAYRESLDALMHRYQFATVDVVGLSAQHPCATTRRRELARTHWHQVAEGRLVVDGSLIFGLQAGEAAFLLQCERGDFIGLPAGMGHWLITGNPPNFRTVRLFTATASCPALPVPQPEDQAALPSG